MKKTPRKLSSSLALVAERLRAEREAERFSQYELAEALGITRAALSSFELCENPLSFRVGMEFCRRLDLSPRWLATGAEPKRPFVSPGELGVTPEALNKQKRRGVDFLSGYEAVLASSLETWVKQNPPDELVRRMMQGGPEPAIRRLPTLEIIRQLKANLEILLKGKQAKTDLVLETHLRYDVLMLEELRSRIEAWQSKIRRG